MVNPATIGATMKAAARRLVAACGGRESCALIPGIRIVRGPSYAEYADANELARHMPIDVVAMLEADCGTLHVTAELARANGHMLVPMPRALLDGSDLSLALGELGKEVGEVFHDLSTAFSDGRIDEAEYTNNKKQIADAQRALAVLDALNEARRAKAIAAGEV